VLQQLPAAQVKFARVDAKALPFMQEHFDVVLSLYVLHHANGYRRALSEIARVLKPGGRLLVIDVMRPRFLPSLPASMAPEGVLTKSEWHEMFTSSGLTITQWQTRYFLGPLPRCSVVACRGVQPYASAGPHTVPHRGPASASGGGDRRAACERRRVGPAD
jgi:SAM-dependent methyltransferase